MDNFRGFMGGFGDDVSDFPTNEEGEIIIPPKKLKAARTVEEISDAFDAMALTTREDMDKFYVETMEARTGNPYKSPIVDIERACRRPSERNAMLLLGHRGSGKSTELNDMKLRLEEEGRPVVIIQCEERLPLTNKPRFSDLLILMGESLYQIARDWGVTIPDDTLTMIQNFWTSTVQVKEKVKAEEITVGAGLEIGTPGLFKAVTALFAKLNSDLKFNDTVREQSEKTIENHYEDWRRILRRLSDGIWRKARKQPILIFEGLDHLENLEEAHDLFFSHAGKLTDVSFPVIYTFPIALYYHKDFATFEHLFREAPVFPMLKLETIDRQPYPQGMELLRKIVDRRANAGLIRPEARDLMIAKTGGSLRDLFQAIRAAGEMATYRGYRTRNIENETITLQDAQAALKEVQSNLTRRIEGDEHRFLAEICIYPEKRREITKSKMLLDMLQARAALEYNGERWFNVHPLVADYLEELRFIKRKDDDSEWEAGERMSNTQTP